MIKSTNEKVPYFNAPVYLQNKTQIGKVDEIFGPINEVVRRVGVRHRRRARLPHGACGPRCCLVQMFTVKCDAGVKAASFKANDKVYINPEKLLPMARFLPAPYVGVCSRCASLVVCDRSRIDGAAAALARRPRVEARVVAVSHREAALVAVLVHVAAAAAASVLVAAAVASEGRRAAVVLAAASARPGAAAAAGAPGSDAV